MTLQKLIANPGASYNLEASHLNTPLNNLRALNKNDLSVLGDTRSPQTLSKKRAAIKKKRFNGNTSYSLNQPGKGHGSITVLGGDNISRRTMPGTRTMQELPYEISNSSWTPAETARFNRMPVHGGGLNTPGMSKLASIERQNNQPNASNTNRQDPLSLAKQIMGPLKIDTRGFSGNASKARGQSQRAAYQKNLAALAGKLATVGIADQGSTERMNIDRTARSTDNALSIMAEKEISDNKSNALLAYNKWNQNKDNNKNNLTDKGLFKFVADKDPITGASLSTGKFYNAYNGEWKQPQDNLQPSSQDTVREFISKYK